MTVGATGTSVEDANLKGRCQRRQGTSPTSFRLFHHHLQGGLTRWEARAPSVHRLASSAGSVAATQWLGRRGCLMRADNVPVLHVHAFAYSAPFVSPISLARHGTAAVLHAPHFGEP